jgi:hypothetical protein
MNPEAALANEPAHPFPSDRDTYALRLQAHSSRPIVFLSCASRLATAPSRPSTSTCLASTPLSSVENSRAAGLIEINESGGEEI